MFQRTSYLNSTAETAAKVWSEKFQVSHIISYVKYDYHVLMNLILQMW